MLFRSSTPVKATGKLWQQVIVAALIRGPCHRAHFLWHMSIFAQILPLDREEIPHVVTTL